MQREAQPAGECAMGKRSSKISSRPYVRCSGCKSAWTNELEDWRAFSVVRGGNEEPRILFYCPTCAPINLGRVRGFDEDESGAESAHE